MTDQAPAGTTLPIRRIRWVTIVGGAALLGVGVGGAFHAIGHVLDRDLGGSSGTDIPVFSLIAAVLLWAGIAQLRAVGPPR